MAILTFWAVFGFDAFSLVVSNERFLAEASLHALLGAYLALAEV